MNLCSCADFSYYCSFGARLSISLFGKIKINKVGTFPGDSSVSTGFEDWNHSTLTVIIEIVSVLAHLFRNDVFIID